MIADPCDLEQKILQFPSYMDSAQIQKAKGMRRSELRKSVKEDTGNGELLDVCKRERWTSASGACVPGLKTLTTVMMERRALAPEDVVLGSKVPSKPKQTTGQAPIKIKEEGAREKSRCEDRKTGKNGLEWPEVGTCKKVRKSKSERCERRQARSPEAADNDIEARGSSMERTRDDRKKPAREQVPESI